MNLNDKQKERFFGQVLELARKGWGSTHPNPMVGALVVERGEIVAEGYHHACGEPHAEVEALASLGRKPDPEAAMFISLEPCSTHGKTPPCTAAILESGIKKVFVATTDPNPKHAGAGLDLLKNAEVDVELAPDSLAECGQFRAQADGKPAGVEVLLTCYEARYQGVITPSAEIEAVMWCAYDDRGMTSLVTQCVMASLYEQKRLM